MPSLGLGDEWDTVAGWEEAQRRHMDNKKTWTSEFWFDANLSQEEFIAAFEAHFEGGEAEHLPVVADARPGYMLFHLHVPFSRKEELVPFLDQYAKEHNSGNELKPATEHPFNPLD